jgi:hypothetical protein
MSIFDGDPDLTDISNYGQLEGKTNARLYVRHALVDNIAFRCCSKENVEMVMLSFDSREKDILSQPEMRFSRVVIYPCSC